MRNNIIIVVAFIGLITFFMYATNISNYDRADRSRILGATEQLDQQANAKAVEVGRNIQHLNEILPNADQLKDFEILEEAELLLASQDSQSINNGLSILNILSQENNGHAAYTLAQLYEKGLKVDQNLEKSLALYKQSALDGYEDANIYLFNHYLDHDDMNSEHLKATLSWFTEASENDDNPIADYALAHMYSRGLGVTVDHEQAIVYYQKAANANFVLAYEPLGYYYLQSTDEPSKVKQALLLFQRAANEDIDSAQYQLGAMYASGIGVKQDYETAKFWYEKAANHRFLIANIALGQLYENGLGVDKDNLKAYNYYRVAAESGDEEGQNLVARAFERGLGVDQDIERAIFWYGESAKRKNAYAEYNLGRIFEEYDVVRNLDEAKFWYEKAADSGIPEAKQALQRLVK